MTNSSSQLPRVELPGGKQRISDTAAELGRLLADTREAVADWHPAPTPSSSGCGATRDRAIRAPARSPVSFG